MIHNDKSVSIRRMNNKQSFGCWSISIMSRPYLQLAIGKPDLFLTQLCNLVTHNARPRPGINDEVDDGDEKEWMQSQVVNFYLKITMTWIFFETL